MFDKKSYYSIFSVLVLFVAVFYSFYSLVPHTISDESTEKTKFSTIRAMRHIENMTEKYHFVGTPYHKTVREYIISELVKLGLEPEVQEQFALNSKWRGATINKNIVARIKGKKQGKILMVLSHYDSAPFASKGASDDAVGVAVILEGIRSILESDIKPVNDIIVLITDGEEVGLVGAKAFVEHHKWAKDVGFVINFEARGSGGPSYTLLETNGGNSKMLKEFIKANPKHPIANSFLYSVYKMLPNDTDLTMFREIGDIDGYNFAFIDDFYDYHNATDDFEHVDINTVEHQGDYLMSLLNYFTKKEIGSLKSDKDLIFFNFSIFGIVAYPFSFAAPIFFALLFIFFLLLVYGFTSKKLIIRNVLKGIGLFLASLVFGILLTMFGWKLILIIHPEYMDILHGFPYNGHYYIAGFMFVIIAFMLFAYRKWAYNLKLSEVLVGPIIFWFIINALFVYLLIGASFLIIPIGFILIIFSIELFFTPTHTYRALIYSFILVPGLIIVSPFIDMFPVGLRMVSLPVSAVFTILLIGISFPVFMLIDFKRELLGLLIILSIGTFVVAEINSGFDLEHPKPNSINYIYYFDKGEAYWETYTHELDDWLKTLMGDEIKKGGVLETGIDSKYHANITYHSKAKSINLPKPEVKIEYDTIIDKNRNVTFVIKPNRSVNRIDFILENDIVFNSILVNGFEYNKKSLKFSKQDNRMLTYYFTEEEQTIELSLSFDMTKQPKIRMYEMSYNLFENELLSLPKRPQGYCSMPFVANDLIIDVMQLKF